MTFEEVTDMLRCTDNQLYKHNAQGSFRVIKRGKRCLYFYANVVNVLLSWDTAIKARPDLHQDLPMDELPKLWPMFNLDGTPTTADEREAEREARRAAARSAKEAAKETDD